MARKEFVPFVVMGIILVLESLSPLEAVAPTWSYRIENIAHFSMSRNGEYLIVACEEDSLCKGKFYVFDRYGNIVKDGCIESKITAADIANNGAFFLGTGGGCYFSSASGEINRDIDMEGEVEFVSMSRNGEIAVAGTKKEILTFDGQDEKNRKPVSDEGEVTALAVSDNGSTIACGISPNIIWILDSQLTTLEEWGVQGEVKSIAMTSDGSRLVYGNQENRIFCVDSSGNQVWEYSRKDSEETAEENVFPEVAISFDGSLVAVLSKYIVLLNSFGEEVQDIKRPGAIQHMRFSQSGEVLSYTLRQELVYLELYQHGSTLTHEYMISSIETTQEDDEFTEIWSFDDVPQSVKVADINGDGQNEIICSFLTEVVVLNRKKVILWREPFGFQPEISVMDLDSDFVPEVVVTSRDNHMKFVAFNEEGQKLESHEFYSRWYEKLPSEEDIMIQALWSGDIDNDGITEVVCKVSANYLLKPRGIYVFEYPSFKEEWYYPSSPNVETVNIADLDNNGTLEIVCGTSASCHGRKDDDTDDCHVYVFALNYEGTRLWNEEIESGYKSVDIAVADLDDDGTNEVVCGGRSFEDEWGELIVLDAKGSQVIRKNLGYPIFLNGVSDFSFDGNMEILISDNEGFLFVYDQKLQFVRKSDVKILNSSDTWINDIDGDRKKEIIAVSDDKKVIILSNGLGKEWTTPLSFPCQSVTVANLSGCKNDLLIAADKLYLYSYTSQSLQPCALPSRTREDEIEEHITKGDNYSKRRIYLKAIEEYDLAITKLQELDDTERLPDVTRKRKETYEKYEKELSEAIEYIKSGELLLLLEDFQGAKEALLKARRISDTIGRSDMVEELNLLIADLLLEEGKHLFESKDFQGAEKALLEANDILDTIGRPDMVVEVKISIADLLLEEGKYLSESKDFRGAEKVLKKSQEIYLSIGRSDKEREAEEILSDLEPYLQAQELIAEGKKKESPWYYGEAIQYYEEALQIYEDSGITEETDEVKEVKLLLDQTRTKHWNITFIQIIFAVSIIVVSLSYFTHRDYRGENRGSKTASYGLTLMVLTGVLIVSYIGISLPLRGITYLMTFSMCLLFSMIVITYLRR